MSQVAQNLENRFNAPFVQATGWEPRHHVNGYSFPLMPVVMVGGAWTAIAAGQSTTVPAGQQATTAGSPPIIASAGQSATVTGGPHTMPPGGQSATTAGSHPTITTAEQPGSRAAGQPVIALVQWGLVPAWCRDPEQAEEMRSITLNARSETAFDKPSFRKAVASRRCLIPADGFFEWQTTGNRKIPWFITLRDVEIFSFGGIWETWEYPGSAPLHTFSLLTTDANPLMAEIHNSKKRMPLILPPEKEELWLRHDLSRQEVEHLMVPLPEEAMKAWTISSLITARGANTNTPEVKKPYSWAPPSQLF